MQSAEILRALTSSAGHVDVICRGSSMEPTLRAGDRVRVHRAGRIRTGDVVLIAGNAGADPILHRIVAAPPGASWIIHCGDAGLFGRPGIARRDRIIARADLPRRRPSLACQLAGWCALLAGLADRALKGSRRS